VNVGCFLVTFTKREKRVVWITIEVLDCLPKLLKGNRKNSDQDFFMIVGEKLFASVSGNPIFMSGKTLIIRIIKVDPK